jgi:hypothetical protein
MQLMVIILKNVMTGMLGDFDINIYIIYKSHVFEPF